MSHNKKIEHYVPKFCIQCGSKMKSIPSSFRVINYDQTTGKERTIYYEMACSSDTNHIVYSVVENRSKEWCIGIRKDKYDMSRENKRLEG